MKRITSYKTRLENVKIAASETAPSWRIRCYNILDALELDFGEPPPHHGMPDDDSYYSFKLDILERENDILRRQAKAADMTLPEMDSYRVKFLQNLLEGQNELIEDLKGRIEMLENVVAKHE